MKNNLAEFRLKYNYTQKAISEKLNTTLSFYSKIESGDRNPSYNFLVKFKENFPDESIDEIFFNTKNHKMWIELEVRKCQS